LSFEHLEVSLSARRAGTQSIGGSVVTNCTVPAEPLTREVLEGSLGAVVTITLSLIELIGSADADGTDSGRHDVSVGTSFALVASLSSRRSGVQSK